MVRHALTTALATAAALAPSVIAQKCTRDSHCPEDAPCCGLYGDCGVGAFCLGGCDPTMSHALDSCVPNPVCQKGTYKFDNLDDVQSIDKYLGDASDINWQSQGTAVPYNDGEGVLLTLAEDTSGTLLASTFYVWYGKICANMTSSQGKGVVTAFILMSDVKDEIDFEFVGVDTDNVQSNFYSQGVTVYTNSDNLTVSNTVAPHKYCVDWSPDELKWTVDGKDLRTVQRSDTWNKTSGRFDYPQTPSRVMLSLWPAGISKNAEGTIEWAGGLIDWNSQYMQNGYYYNLVTEVTVDCYDPPSDATIKGDKSYVYTDAKNPTNNTVEMTDDLVVLGSLMGTGEDPGEASASSSSAAPTRSVAMVPGGNPGGGARQETVTADGGSPTGTGPQSTGGSSGGGNSAGFEQGNNNGNGVASLEPGLGRIGGSALAIVVAILGLLVL